MQCVTLHVLYVTSVTMLGSFPLQRLTHRTLTLAAVRDPHEGTPAEHQAAP